MMSSRFTNNPWSFSKSELSAQLGYEPEVINDLAALARAIPFLSPDQYRPIPQPLDGGWKPHICPTKGVTAVIAPGTGLGVATLVSYEGGLIDLAGEGGHATAAPGNREEAQIIEKLWKRWEHYQ